MKPDAIVIGMGPSFWEWLKQPLPEGVPLYGTGQSPKYVQLTAYLYACPPKREFLPTDGTLVYARHEVWEPGMVLWDDLIPRGGSAGGMALGLACSNHTTVALVGFDGFGGVPDYFLSDFRGLVRYWKSRGRRLLTLMPESYFDDLLEKLD